MPFRMLHRALRGALTLVAAIAMTTFVVVPLGSTPAFAIPGGPTNDVAPALSAPVAQANVAISTDNGSWTTSGGVINYTYQWRFCDENGNGCSDVPAATNDTVTIGGGGIGGTLKAEVFATDDNGTHEQDSNLVRFEDTPGNTVAPVVSGTTTDGQTLSVDNGTFTGGFLTYSYRWQQCNSSGVSCVNIANATDNQYTLTPTDVGHKIRAVVTAANDIDTASKASAATAVIAGAPPLNTVAPTITGIAKNAEVLTAHDGTWTGTPTIGFTYQWERCDQFGANCSDIGGETNSTYTVQQGDEGDTIDVAVRGDNGIDHQTVLATHTAVITANEPTNTVLPSITGTDADGNLLTADHGTWTGFGPIIYSYQWLRCDPDGNNCADINGEINSTYTLTSNDINSTIRVSVQASNDDGADAPIASNATPVISAIAPTNSGDHPSITGSAVRGQELTANTGDWSGSMPIDFTYQWRACNSSGVACVDIAGATGSTYDLGLDDIGTRLRVVITAQNTGGTASAVSAATPLVTASVPDAPTNVVATRGNQSISVAFDAPFDGGSEITGYTVGCTSIDLGANSPMFNTGASSPIVVSGLTNGDSYTCRVVATNAEGDSDPSSASDSVTLPDVVPGTPDAPTVIAHDASITATFSAPTNDGTAITDYTVDCASSDGGTENTNDGASSPITVTGLTNGKTYTCTVFATNNAGNGDPSDPSDAVEPASLPQNTLAPNITGTAIAQRTLTIHPGTWTGTPTPGFAYQWQRCDSHGNNCTNITGANGNLRVLSNGDVGHKLRVMVQGTNIAGPTFVPSTPTAVIGAVPQSINGPYFYDGKKIVKSPAGSVGAAVNGSTVWVVYPNGNLTGPHFAPGNGTLVGTHLAKPIIGIVATPSGKGYWMFAADGGVFAFGDAHFYGSTGGMQLNAPIVSMAATPTGHGYWLFAADGGVFSYGDAAFHGSTGGQTLAHPVVAMLATPSGHGYWLVTSDGQAIRFGDATNIGSVTSLHRTDIVGLVSTGAGYRFVTKTLALLTPS